MNQSLQTAYPGYAGSGLSVEQRDRVLRNTYWLLALSMVPTVLGAWIGVATGIARAMSRTGMPRWSIMIASWRYSARSTILRLSEAIAAAGFSPLGQALVQLLQATQRNSSG